MTRTTVYERAAHVNVDLAALISAVHTWPETDGMSRYRRESEWARRNGLSHAIVSGWRIWYRDGQRTLALPVSRATAYAESLGTTLDALRWKGVA